MPYPEGGLGPVPKWEGEEPSDRVPEFTKSRPVPVDDRTPDEFQAEWKERRGDATDVKRMSEAAKAKPLSGEEIKANKLSYPDFPANVESFDNLNTLGRPMTSAEMDWYEQLEKPEDQKTYIRTLREIDRKASN